ncbi:M56 family metallopeptidase [Pseudonocardia nigra]|uniref:M56 family metallopeptidase n=1 Tax=Pseudonocardia nigra TaxID=1921578 RepID=UPI001C602E28|nr:M56 family metallopeptidase [Pseudonocardia nigra]
MSLAVCLLGYGFAVAVFAPDVLLRATHSGCAPRMGIRLWVLAIGSVLVAWIAAVVLAAIDLLLARGDLGQVLAGCVAILHAAVTGAHGTPVQVGLAALAVLVVAGLVVLAARLGGALDRTRRHTHRHADAARLVGRWDHALGAVVVDAPDRLAYAVAGRPHTIVLSRATVDALDEPHLQAVLAHERAHLAGRHHLLLAIIRALAATMPRITLFTAGNRELSRLLEMRADDAAAREHGRRTLAEALLVLSTGSTLPPRALAAAGTAVADRAERLMFPPAPEQVRATRLRLGLAAIALLIGPLLALAQSGLCDAVISI